MFRIPICVFALLTWTSATLIFAADSQPKPAGYNTATDITYRTSDDASINEKSLRR